MPELEMRECGQAALCPLEGVLPTGHAGKQLSTWQANADNNEMLKVTVHQGRL